jgi:hypothetical protein
MASGSSIYPKNQQPSMDEEFAYFTNRFQPLFGDWKNRIEKITIDSRFAQGS